MTNSHVRLNPKQKLTFFHSVLILSFSDASWEAGDVQLPPGVLGVHTSKKSYSIIYKEPTFAFTNKQSINLFFSAAPAQPEEAADQGGRAACRGVEVI